MAFGGLKGSLTANNASIPASFAATGSVSVAVGDLIFCVVGERINLTTSAVADSLGHSYTFVNSLDAGNATGTSYYKIATSAGTLTSVTATATASSDDGAIVAGVYEGPFAASPLDANPTPLSDGATPFTAPSTLTLAQADELVLSWFTATNGFTGSAMSPGARDVEAGTGTGASTMSAALGSTVVSATTAVVPAWTVSAGVPSSGVVGTASFKKGSSNKTLAAGAGAYTFTGTAATLTKGHPIAAGAGSYALTGTAANLLHKWKVTADAGSYALTGTAASVLHKLLLTAGVGSYALTGTAATTRKGYPLAAVAGFYAFTGATASLLHGWKLAAAAGSYALTGSTATLTLTSGATGKVLIAGGNACTYDPANTSANITLSNGSRTLTANNASATNGDLGRSTAHHATGKYYSETVIDVNFSTYYAAVGVVNSSAGITDPNAGNPAVNSASFFADGNIYGNSVTVLTTGLTFAQGDRIGVEVDATARTMRVRVNGGSWSSLADISYITGDLYAHGFVRSDGVNFGKITTNFGETAYVDTPPIGASDWTTVTPASYVLSGADANVYHNRIVAAGVGSYALIGTAASVLHGWKIAAGAGSYALTGTNASPLHNSKIPAGAGSYSLTGTAANLSRGQSIVVDGGVYTITGSAAVLRKASTLAAASGSYALTGSDATLAKGGSTPDDARDYPFIANMGTLMGR